MMTFLRLNLDIARLNLDNVRLNLEFCTYLLSLSLSLSPSPLARLGISLYRARA